jgi:uncharacterized membrane protein YidH (DUF202 family)
MQAMLITLFLITINIFNTVRSDAQMPKHSTLNAIEIYIVICILMIFAALMEYALILYAFSVRTLSN